MITDQGIEFKFPTVRSKLQNLFPFDPKYDIQIIFKNNKYELQTAYLRLQSGFFKNYSPNVTKVIKIQQNFYEDYFQQIMKCFYGGTFKCPRSSAFQVWKIFQYLKIDSFKKQMIKDMKHNFEKYNFFELMTFGFVNSVQEIFNNCLLILDSQNFVQIKKNKDQLLLSPLQVFKFLVSTHNRRSHNKRALNFIQINNILSQYCQKHQYSEDFCRDLKFQLIDRTELSAEQYRIIFMQNAKTQSQKQIPQINFSKRASKSKNQPILAQSAQINSVKSLTLQQKQHWYKKLQSLKVKFQISNSQHINLHASADNLSKSLRKKADQSKLKQKNLTKMENLVRQIQNEIQQKGQIIKKIAERIQKIQTGYSKKSIGAKEIPLQQQQKDQFVQSHIIPGFCLGDIMNDVPASKKQTNNLKPSPTVQPTASTANFSKKKKTVYQTQVADKQSSSQGMYKNCLSFDKEPISIPKKYLDSLAKILDKDIFVKKKQLTLVFRRSKNNGNVGDPSAIKNRPSLLVLFQTSYKKYVGGYISVQIPSYAKIETFCDYQAFIFSLTHNVKMPIMKGQQKTAISLNKHYLLSFGNDLMISSDCLNEISYCQWPTIYEVPKNSKCMTAKDLIGAGQFKIQQIDIYEVRNEEIEMVL